MSYQTPESGIIEPSLNGANLTIPKASQACHSCRRQKRRCDKKLPACSLCARMARPCDYSDTSPAPTADDFNALRARLAELEARLHANTNDGSMSGGTPYQPTPQTHSVSPAPGLGQPQPAPIYVTAAPYQIPQVLNRFPTIAFLDAESFANGRVDVPTPQIDIPLEVLDLLGDGPAIQAAIDEYFDTVHTWMPIVSKKRLNRNMHNPLWEAGADLALLFLCMKLATLGLQEGLEQSHHPVYTAAKRFVAQLEAGGVVSLHMLQAYVLISFFEMGHAIYPAAWMTVGSASRYGLLLGLHDPDHGARLLVQASTWTEMEERRRSWWAVIILERMVAMGSVGKYPVPEDPDERMALPSFTEQWDAGELPTIGFIPSNISLSEPIGSFGRLCQASLMAGRVLRHHHQRYTNDSDKFSEASSLYSELAEFARTLVREAQSDYLSFTGPMSVCFSALVGLCEPYACGPMRGPTDSKELGMMQVQAVEGLRSVSSSIKDLSLQIAANTPNAVDIDRVNIFVLDALYCGASNFAWDVRESGNVAAEEGLEAIRQCLRRFTTRWRAAQECLRILEAQEFAYNVNVNVNVGVS